MVWTCAEEKYWIYWIKDAEYGACTQAGEKETTERINGCSEGGNAEGWWDRRGC